MTSPTPYQILPRLTDQEYAELKSDIRENGVRVPIDVDEEGVVIDGHHRAWITAELGIDCPRRVVRNLSDEQKRSHAIAVNVHRRTLSREQKRELIAKSLKADPQLSDRQHAERTGVSPTTVGTVRAEMEAVGDVSKLDTRMDATGRRQPASKPTAAPAPTPGPIMDSGPDVQSPAGRAEAEATTVTVIDGRSEEDKRTKGPILLSVRHLPEDPSEPDVVDVADVIEVPDGALFADEAARAADDAQLDASLAAEMEDSEAVFRRNCGVLVRDALVMTRRLDIDRMASVYAAPSGDRDALIRSFRIIRDFCDEAQTALTKTVQIHAVRSAR